MGSRDAERMHSSKLEMMHSSLKLKYIKVFFIELINQSVQPCKERQVQMLQLLKYIRLEKCNKIC